MTHALKPIAEMTEKEMLDELDSPALSLTTDADIQAFENNLILRAYCLGWTGDPLKQPIQSVLAAARQVIRERAEVQS